MMMPFYATASETSRNSFTVLDYRIENKLETKVTEVIYDGTTTDVDYKDKPSSGNKFLLVKVSLSVFEEMYGNKFEVEIGNKTYNRMKDDSFLKNHNYSVLSMDSIIIDSTGWIAFEVPDDSQNPETWTILNEKLSSKLIKADENIVVT